MITERYRKRAVWALAVAIGPSALLLSACSGGGTSAAAKSVPLTPAVTGAPDKTPSAFEAVEAQLTALGKDQAFTAASKAASDIAALRELQVQGSLLSTQLRTLSAGTKNCTLISRVGSTAAGLLPQAQLLVDDVPRQVAAAKRAAGPVAPKISAVQQAVSALHTKVSALNDANASDQLQAFTTAAQLLSTNLRGLDDSVGQSTAELAKVNQTPVMLRNVQLNAAKLCGSPAAAKLTLSLGSASAAAAAGVIGATPERPGRSSLGQLVAILPVVQHPSTGLGGGSIGGAGGAGCGAGGQSASGSGCAPSSAPPTTTPVTTPPTTTPPTTPPTVPPTTEPTTPPPTTPPPTTEPTTEPPTVPPTTDPVTEPPTVPPTTDPATEPPAPPAGGPPNGGPPIFPIFPPAFALQ